MVRLFQELNELVEVSVVELVEASKVGLRLAVRMRGCKYWKSQEQYGGSKRNDDIGMIN